MYDDIRFMDFLKRNSHRIKSLIRDEDPFDAVKFVIIDDLF